MKAPGKNGRVIYIMGVFICSCLSFFFLVLSGIIGERLPIRCYLTFGMLASGMAATCLRGVLLQHPRGSGFLHDTQVRSGPWLTLLGFHHELDGVFMSSAKREDCGSMGESGRAVLSEVKVSTGPHGPFSLLYSEMPAATREVFLEVRVAIKNPI